MKEIQALIRNKLAAIRVPVSGSGGCTPQAQQRQWEADPSKPKAPTVTEATKRLGPMGERGWIYCSHCCQWGLHIRPECTWSMDRIRSIPKMDQTAHPAGTGGGEWAAMCLWRPPYTFGYCLSHGVPDGRAVWSILGMERILSILQVHSGRMCRPHWQQRLQ